MRYLSVCSGIEAASVAWHPLGWQAVAFSEIEKFPSAVLAARWPDVPNLGDMLNYQNWPAYDSIDLLAGGTPCQGFSIAGLRGGLDDPRSQLMLTYVEIAAKYRPRWLVWENVPGVLSSNGGADFAAFLGALTGRTISVPEGGWSNSGTVQGIAPAYGVAWRSLDAQFFGVAQRRERVFVVGYLGDWRRAAAVLFERASLCGHPAPSRETGKDVAGTLSARTSGGGGLGTDFELSGGLTAIANSLRGEGFDASEDGTGSGTPIVPVAFDTTQITSPENRCQPAPGKPCHPLAAKGHPPAIAFNLRGREGGAMPEMADVASLRAASGGSSRSYVACAPAVAFDSRMRGAEPKVGREERPPQTMIERTGALDSTKPWNVATGPQVRRLTPRECERLQGFPDDLTLVEHRGKPAADGPRYKALGNSMAVPVMRWIGERIAAAERLTESNPDTAPAPRVA